MVIARCRVEDRVASRRRLDLEGFQLLRDAVTQRQIVRKDELARFESVREIAE